MPIPTKVASKATRHHGDGLLKKEFDRHESLRLVAILAIAALGVMVLVGLFAPGLSSISLDRQSSPR